MLTTNKKLLFISGFKSKLLEYDGVMKKVILEIRTLKELGFEVDYIELDNEEVFLISKDKKLKISKIDSSFYKTMRQFYSVFSKRKDLYERYDLIYMRYEHISFPMIHFLKQFKRSKKKFVFAELPTFISKPYDNLPFHRKLNFYLKKALNSLIPKGIDYFLTFSDHKRIYRTPTIQIENFADVSNLPIRNPKNLKNEIHLLALAQLSPAHGFDRVIDGLKIYYKDHREIKIYLHIVGEGVAKKELSLLTEKYQLENFIFFHGYQGGSELNELFNLCSIGIGAIAVFRKGSSKVSELKIREYTARGLPFIYNAVEPQIEGQRFCLKVPFDESPIDMMQILEFNESLQHNFDIREMRLFAEENFNCATQLKKIIDIVQK